MELSDVFKKFAIQFPPASPDESTLQLTMFELVKVFSSFYPTDFENKTLYQLMIEYGYQYEPVNKSGTINFYWFLKEVKSRAN